MQNRPLFEILDDFEFLAQELCEIDVFAIKDEIAKKVDNYREAISALELYEKKLADDIESLSRAKKACSNKAREIKDRILDAMKVHGYEKLPGDRWRVQIQSLPVVETLRDACEDDLILNPQLVRTKIEWNKDVLKEGIKSGTIDPSIAVEKRSEFVRFYPNNAKGK